MACVLEEEFSNLIDTQYYCTDGSEPPAEYVALCLARWKAHLNERTIEAYLPTDDSMQKPQPCLFIPIHAKEKPVGLIHLESRTNRIVLTDEQQMALQIIARMVSDTLEKASSELRIKFMAYYDDLTKLPNRQLFHERAEQSIHLARRNKSTVGFMFLDLDSFKSVNDTLGHESGDELIQSVAQRLAGSLRKSDTVARFGGDEFLIMLNTSEKHVSPINKSKLHQGLADQLST